MQGLFLLPCLLFVIGNLMKNEKKNTGPASDIPKVYDRPAVEAKWREFWEKNQIYKFRYDKSMPVYSVDTPPPYVSADYLHAGHIMSYGQAEFIVRYKRMRGFNIFYPMGFDDNGLPTERFVEKKYKVDKSTISKAEFIKLCLKETEIGEQNYKKVWDGLGISVDWSKTYSSINPTATRVSQWSVIDLHKKGHLYRSENPIQWCTTCRTALAQADLEDKTEKSKMNFINFKSVSTGDDLQIATSRPELIPACVALYVNPEDKRYKKLIGTMARVPLFDYEVPIKASPKVDMEFGTGLMMVCTWGDTEDLEKWRTDCLDTRELFTKDGKLNELGGKYEGMGIYEAREAIIGDLQKFGSLVKQEDIEHALNVHERCGTPVEFIQSKQWFIKIKDMKETWMKLGDKLNWYPKSRKKDYEIWVDSIKWDWCISRQRYYGVPFPIWYCTKCEEPIFAREEDLPVNPFEDKPPVDKCPKCGGTEFRPEEDVMDTWATSSCTPFLIRELVKDEPDGEKAYKQLYPPTLRPNAYEIIRTWDFYSIVKSYYNFGGLPFSDVMISGRGYAEDGSPISKRLGNYIPAEKLIEDYGADALRYWATGATLGRDMRFSPREIEIGKKLTIKLWNVARFLMMYLTDFDAKAGEPKLELPDIWILDELNKVIKQATDGFESYEFSKARNATDDFFWTKFTDNYIEFVKYRLNGDDATSKYAAQWTLSKILNTILKLFAPIVPFITEEIYSLLYAKQEGLPSVHLSSWPEEMPVKEAKLISDFDGVLKAVDEVRKHKSENGMRLGEELPEYRLQTKVDLKKYGNFLQNALRVKKLS